MINIELQRGQSESTGSFLRRFTKKMQGSGIVTIIRGRRYKERAKSRYTKKKKALKRITRREEILHLIKLGKLQPKTSHGR